MTVRDVTDYLKAFLQFCEKDGLGIPSREPFNLAISALEKQIPKNPDYEGDGYADGELIYDIAHCPECSHEFEYEINDWGSAYCPDCGQALDWS